MQRKISELFAIPPYQYGFRGDKYFWKYLEEYFSNIHFPYSEAELINDIYTLFFEVSGVRLTENSQPYVEQFAYGGMSSGQLSGEFWIRQGIPLIVDRYRALIK